MSGKLKYAGKARIRRLSTGKESFEDEKSLSCTVALCLQNVDVDTVDMLDPLIGKFLFDSGGLVRNPLIGPITIQARMGGYRVGIGRASGITATVKKITLWPSDGERFCIELIASFQPDGDNFIEVAESIAEEVPFTIESINAELW